ncbi:MAG TPA: hypothetical protein VL995_15100 [Cellvibrio sp.]|nr:hypothetical protein [Cellvibrio sp.]
MLNSRSRLLVSVLIIITSFLILFSAIQAFYVFEGYQYQQRNTQTWAEQHTQKMTSDLSARMSEIANIAEQLATELGTSDYSPCDIEKGLRSVYLQHTDFFALGVAFDAGKSATPYRLYAPFIRQDSNGAAVERLDSYYDYLAGYPVENADLNSNPEAWYGLAQTQARQWLGPFYEAALGRFIIRYTSPVYNSQQQKIGLAYVDISLEWLHDQIEKYDIRDNNYLRLVTSQGQELYHSFKGIDQVTQQLSMAEGKKLLEQTTINELTKVPAWQHIGTLTATQWRLISVVSKPQLFGIADSPQTKIHNNHKDSFHLLTNDKRVAWITLLTLVVILSYTCLRYIRRRTTEFQLWIDTAIYTMILFTGVIFIWVLEYGVASEQNERAVILANKAIIEKYEREHALQALAAHEEAPVYVPVGLFIQSIEFLSATNVNITGYIWHRYQTGQVSDYKIGTVFPEAIETRINLAYEKAINNETLKGWYFETTLRENFTPDRFPLDRQSVWIRLWHEKIGDNIVLVPDLKAYENLDTRALPGIEKDFVLSGWSLFRSYFEMHDKHYNTRLGMAGSSSNLAVPELYFNVEIMRNFINPFLAHLFPLLVVVLMLYAIVITMSTDENKKDFLGFNAAGVVASCSALFFVALISHVQMRDELKANSVVYLEYFYLITYIIILLITANAILLSLKVPFRFIQFHDNLLPKLLYWPVISGALFLSTVWQFSR